MGRNGAYERKLDEDLSFIGEIRSLERIANTFIFDACLLPQVKQNKIKPLPEKTVLHFT